MPLPILLLLLRRPCTTAVPVQGATATASEGRRLQRIYTPAEVLQESPRATAVPAQGAAAIASKGRVLRVPLLPAWRPVHVLLSPLRPLSAPMLVCEPREEKA